MKKQLVVRNKNVVFFFLKILFYPLPSLLIKKLKDKTNKQTEKKKICRPKNNDKKKRHLEAYIKCMKVVKRTKSLKMHFIFEEKEGNREELTNNKYLYFIN